MEVVVKPISYCTNLKLHVFSGQRCVSGEYSIQVKPKVKPVIHACSKESASVSLSENVKKELSKDNKQSGRANLSGQLHVGASQIE